MDTTTLDAHAAYGHARARARLSLSVSVTSVWLNDLLTLTVKNFMSTLYGKSLKYAKITVSHKLCQKNTLLSPPPRHCTGDWIIGFPAYCYVCGRCKQHCRLRYIMYIIDFLLMRVKISNRENHCSWSLGLFFVEKILDR